MLRCWSRLLGFRRLCLFIWKKKIPFVATEIKISFARETCSHIVRLPKKLYHCTAFQMVRLPFLFHTWTWKCSRPHVLVYPGHIRRQRCLCISVCVSGRAVFVLGQALFLWCVWARMCPACVDPAPCLCGSTLALRQKRKLCFNSISRALPSACGPLC